MKAIKAIFQVLAWVLLIGIFSAVGFATDKPVVMVPLYGILFAIGLGCMVLYAKTHQKRVYKENKWANPIKTALGAIFIVACLILPTLILNSLRPGQFSVGALIGITVGIMAIIFVSVMIINKSKGKNIVLASLGYLLLVIISAVPAFAIKNIDSSYATLGLVYYIFICVTALGWVGASLVSKDKTVF